MNSLLRRTSDSDVQTASLSEALQVPGAMKKGENRDLVLSHRVDESVAPDHQFTDAGGVEPVPRIHFSRIFCSTSS